MKALLEKNESILADVTEPMCMGLAFRPAQGSEVAQLVLCCAGLSGNKKIPPKTLLMKVTDGRVATSQAGGMKWGFTKTKTVMVVEKSADGKLSQQTSLHAYATKVGATGVIRHSAFKGAMPAELSPPSDLEFIPKDAAVAEFLKFCLSRSDINPIWQVRTNSDKVIIPHGVIIYTKKQLVMPAAGRLPIT